MQPSVLPHTRSAAAIAQAKRGGLEKYPNASSRDHAQYCDSSKNRSTVENRSPMRRTAVKTSRIPSAQPKPGTARDRLVKCVSATIEGSQIGGGRLGSTRFSAQVQGASHRSAPNAIESM